MKSLGDIILESNGKIQIRLRNDSSTGEYSATVVSGESLKEEQAKMEEKVIERTLEENAKRLFEELEDFQDHVDEEQENWRVCPALYWCNQAGSEESMRTHLLMHEDVGSASANSRTGAGYTMRLEGHVSDCLKDEKVCIRTMKMGKERTIYAIIGHSGGRVTIEWRECTEWAPKLMAHFQVNGMEQEPIPVTIPGEQDASPPKLRNVIQEQELAIEVVFGPIWN